MLYFKLKKEFSHFDIFLRKAGDRMKSHKKFMVAKKCTEQIRKGASLYLFISFSPKKKQTKATIRIKICASKLLSSVLIYVQICVRVCMSVCANISRFQNLIFILYIIHVLYMRVVSTYVYVYVYKRIFKLDFYSVLSFHIY